MKVLIDTEAKTLVLHDPAGQAPLDLYSDEAFNLLSALWVKVGWNQKYTYTFSWMGRPVIQFPEDMIRVQEAIWAIKPDVVIETGVAHGGSLIYYASLFAAMGKGRVIGVDIEIRPHNRAAIEAHHLFDRITLIEGSSTAPEVVEQVRSHVKPGDTVLVILDSNHSYAHVRDELAAYADMVSVGSYIVATDGLMRDLADVPRGQPGWETDNPATAAEEFAAARDDFALELPERPFNESTLQAPVTHWPSAWLRRTR